MSFFKKETGISWDTRHKEMVAYLTTDKLVFETNAEAVAFAAIIGLKVGKNIPIIESSARNPISTFTFEKARLAPLLWSLYFLGTKDASYDLTKLDSSHDREVVKKIEGYINAGLYELEARFNPDEKLAPHEFVYKTVRNVMNVNKKMIRELEKQQKDS